jgi:hypothetical protein
MRDAALTIPCALCGGSGRQSASHHGGNDPFVWDAGRCESCEGAGETPAPIYRLTAECYRDPIMTWEHEFPSVSEADAIAFSEAAALAQTFPFDCFTLERHGMLRGAAVTDLVWTRER